MNNSILYFDTLWLLFCLILIVLAIIGYIVIPCLYSWVRYRNLKVGSIWINKDYNIDSSNNSKDLLMYKYLKITNIRRTKFITFVEYKYIFTLYYTTLTRFSDKKSFIRNNKFLMKKNYKY